MGDPSSNPTCKQNSSKSFGQRLRDIRNTNLKMKAFKKDAKFNISQFCTTRIFIPGY